MDVATSETVAARCSCTAAGSRSAPDEQDDEDDDRHHPDVEGQLLDVPEPEAEHGADVVAALAHHLVRAEQVGERAAARELGDDHHQDDPRDTTEQGDEAAKHPGVPSQQSEDEGRQHDRAHEAECLGARRDRRDQCQDERGDPPPRRPLQHAHERPGEEQGERVEEVLGDERRGVRHGRQRDGQRSGQDRAARVPQPGG